MCVEPPWDDNLPDVSCFPTGPHPAWYGWSPRHHCHVYHVGVERRAGIEIEPAANWASELLGCMALGRRIVNFHGRPGRTWGVTNSGSSRRAFERELRGRPFTLRTTKLDAGHPMAADLDYRLRLAA